MCSNSVRHLEASNDYQVPNYVLLWLSWFSSQGHGLAIHKLLNNRLNVGIPALTLLLSEGVLCDIRKVLLTSSALFRKTKGSTVEI